MNKYKFSIKLDKGNPDIALSTYECDVCGKEVKSTENMFRVSGSERVDFVCSKSCIDLYVLREV